MTTTPNFALELPANGSVGWGTKVNGNFTTIDTQLKAVADAIAATAPGSNTWLKLVIGSEPALQFTDIVRDANGLIATADVTWPDGTTGDWNTVTASELGITQFTVTYSAKTVTSTITREADGKATDTTIVVS